MSTDDPIGDSLLRQEGTEGPIVVRLLGAGAFRAASRWVASRGALVSVALPSLPTQPTGTLWLHDHPGSRSIADQYAAKCVIERWPWVLLLTGPATDGAHPSQGELVEVPETGEPGVGSPTRVLLDVPADPLSALARAADEGDVTRALALYEHLSLDDPELRRRWCWVELLRLTMAGRSTEVDELGPRLPGRHACRAPVLLMMAEAALNLTRVDRTQLYSQALESGPHTPEQAAEVAFFRAVTTRDVEAMRNTRPGTIRNEVLRRRILHNIGHQVEGPTPTGPYAEAFARFDASPRPVDAFLRIGDFSHAMVLARQSGGDVGGAYLASGEVDDALSAARRAIRANDLIAARRFLAAVEARVSDMGAGNAFLWLLLDARVANHEGAVGRLLSCAARLGAIGPTIWAPAGLVADLLPTSGESADPWCTATYLRLLEDHSRDPGEGLERAFADQAPLPIALGAYVLEDVLASGGAGTVWRGRHRLTGRAVAVKVLDETTPAAVRLFRAEIDVISRFDHPMIVSVLDLLEVDARVEQQSGGAVRRGQPALVMELVDHGTLADHIGLLTWPDIQAALVGVLEALAYAHAYGVIHRDLKPQNILVGPQNSLRLADFGLADLDEDKIAGTPTYMAPEQFRRGPIGPVADVYAVGCIGWSLSCGLPPFAGPVQQLAAAHASAPLPAFEPITPVPQAFEDWLERCLRKDPSARFPSAAAAAEALLAIDGTSTQLPGTPPTLPYPARGSSTFVLQTLLDLPDGVFEPADEGTATRRLHDIFEERASWRPRIPTERLLHKGEPPILYQREAQKSLWTVLMAALSGRTQRIALWGGGGRAILSWLQRRARIAGLAVSEEANPGKVCIVDATGIDPAELPKAKRERWVLVWRDEDVPDTRRIVLQPLHMGAIWWLVYSRILLHTRTACQIAIQALGSPAVAFALVDDWLEDPGVEMSATGLQLLKEPEGRARRATALWRTAVASFRPERLHLAQWIAIKPFAASGAFLRAVTDTDLDLHLEELATGCNDAWRMPPDLRAVVLETLDASELRDLHRFSAAHEVHPSARVLHTVLADPSRENTLAMLEVIRDVRAPPAVLDLVQLHINSHLLEAPEARARWRVQRMGSSELTRRVWDTDPLIADLARLQLFDRVLPWPEGLRERIESELFLPRRPMLTIRLAHALSDQLGRIGRSEHAIALFDRLADHLDGAPGHLPHLLAWGRARCLDGEQAVDALTEALGFAGVELAPTLHIDLADELLRLGRYQEALAQIDQSQGIWSVAADYNRAVALLALERDAVATQLMVRRTTLAMGTMNMRMYIGFCYAELFLHLDEPTPMWEALAQLCSPLEDAVMRSVLERRLDGVPSSPRADRLRAIVGASARATD